MKRQPSRWVTGLVLVGAGVVCLAAMLPPIQLHSKRQGMHIQAVNSICRPFGITNRIAARASAGKP